LDGVWFGTVVIDGNADILDVTEEHIVLRTRDELGVESVAVYALAF